MSHHMHQDHHDTDDAPGDPKPHSHLHEHRPSPVTRRAVRLTLAALIPAALLTVIGLIFLWPGAAERQPWTGGETITGEVLAVQERPCGEADAQFPEQAAAQQQNKCGEVTVRLDSGEQVQTPIPSGPGAAVVEAGDDVILMYGESFEEPGVRSYDIMDHQRGTQLWVLVLAFALAVIAFGRWRGLSALAGLAFTFAVLLLFVVPAILEGSSPLLVAIVGSATIMLVVLYLTHGINIPTSMAVLGTLTALTLTGALSWLAVTMLHLTGMSSEESMFVSFVNGEINMPGLLLAGVLIGALGVLDDVTVTQAYTVSELAAANPTMGFARLYAAAARVGRAHITSVINTIVLAYAGASLPTLLLLTAGGAPWSQMITSEFLAQEIVRSAIGTLGLIAAVPITTALAALAAKGKTEPRARRQPPQRTRRRRLDDLETAWGLEHDDSAISARHG